MIHDTHVGAAIVTRDNFSVMLCLSGDGRRATGDGWRIVAMCLTRNKSEPVRLLPFPNGVAVLT